MKNFEKKRGGSQLNFLDEIIVDNFAGGGGASTGMELATGRPVAIAINTEDVNLDSIPDADVVEVVRCRECEQGGKSANFPGMVYCKNTRTYTNPDDFCSRGKKEETE